MGRQLTGRIDANFVDIRQEGQDIMVRRYEATIDWKDLYNSNDMYY
jgi:hypothetical protein